MSTPLPERIIPVFVMGALAWYSKLSVKYHNYQLTSRSNQSLLLDKSTLETVGFHLQSRYIHNLDPHSFSEMKICSHDFKANLKDF